MWRHLWCTMYIRLYDKSERQREREKGLKWISIAHCKVVNNGIQKNFWYWKILSYFAVFRPVWSSFLFIFIHCTRIFTNFTIVPFLTRNHFFLWISCNSFSLSQITKKIFSDWKMNESVIINPKQSNRLVALIGVPNIQTFFLNSKHFHFEIEEKCSLRLEIALIVINNCNL